MLPFPLLSDLPGIQVFVKIESQDFPIETILSLLRKFGEPRRASIAMFSDSDGFRAMAVIKVEGEEEVGKLEEKLRKVLSEVKGIEFKLRRLRKYGTKYVMRTPPKLMLLGEPLVLIRKSRYLGYLRRICDLLDEGVYAFMRSIGEEDGEMIARIHQDPLKGILKEGKLKDIVEYVIYGMSSLENIPECKVESKGNEVFVKAVWKIQVDGRMRKALIFYLYGLLKGIFKELGAYSIEETSAEELTGLIVSTASSTITIRISAERFS